MSFRDREFANIICVGVFDVCRAEETVVLGRNVVVAPDTGLDS